ncbi:hypothetical protein ACQ86G_30160 [Roseateles chitinivorans]|uniref:hypothetical protein n=1 Tax=Roseateles chitinivorans TaxID=2917965 RepID=UPI003D669304
MAMTLYAGEHREHIAPQDEALLQLAEAARHPQLSALWLAFYDSPRLSSRQAGDLVHELLVLMTCADGSLNPAQLRRGLRLAAFFSAASRDGLEIRTSSD